jgi:predicted AAA+ superfamily ATPase
LAFEPIILRIAIKQQRSSNMSNVVRIQFGTYRGETFTNQEFTLVDDVKEGKKGHFITVRPNNNIGVGRDKIRVNLEDPNHVEYSNRPSCPVETDEQIMDRIESRFEILDDMTKAAINGDVRGMIVTGPPGVGKSYGVERQLEKASLFESVKSVANKKYEVVKGAMTPIGLYATLYRYSDSGSVLVFDDCDSVLMDDLSLNILKAALDSGKKRTIHWNADSSLLRREGIPDRFTFRGAVIFITNIKFNNVRSKKLQDHLEALQSRCHYLDLTLNTEKDKILRIKQIHRKGDLFESYYFDGNEGDQVIDFMEENQSQMREMSLRMALKLADLVKVSPARWKDLAASTCMKNSF